MKKFIFLVLIILTIFSFACQLNYPTSDSSTTTTSVYSGFVIIPTMLITSDIAVQATDRTLVSQDGEGANVQKAIFIPVMSSATIARNLIGLANEFIIQIKALGSIEATVNYKDDGVHPDKTARLTNSSTFGTDGKKCEVWWKDTGVDATYDGKKMLEIDYLEKDGNIDGVMFFRAILNGANDFSLARIEFKKTATTKITVVQVENINDFEDNAGGKFAIFLEESLDGTVTIDGTYTIKGLEAPYIDANDAGDWSATSERAYIFTAVGSDLMNKAEVNLILPKRGEESASSAFANGQTWSLGELYTDCILTKLSQEKDNFNVSTLDKINLAINPDLTVNSTQNELLTALDQLKENANLTSIQGVSELLNFITVINGIKNPVYFYRSSDAISLIGYENVLGLESIVGAGGVSQYTTLGLLLKNSIRTTNGGDFSSNGVYALSVANGTSIAPITGHPLTIGSWTNISETAPVVQ